MELEVGGASSAPSVEGHTGGVMSVCEITRDGRPHLASAGEDRTVRIWDPDTGESVAIPVRHPASAVGRAAGALAVGLSAGALVIGVGTVENVDQPD